MEIIIGCIFLVALLIVLLCFFRTATFTIKIEYPEPPFTELNDQFDEQGEFKGEESKVDFDNMLKEINDLMLGEEDSNE